MAHVILRPGWHLPERLVTPEKIFLNRRVFLKEMGLAGSGLLVSSVVGHTASESAKGPAPVASNKFPAPRNPEFNPGWRLSNEKVAGSYNNFYEFSPEKDQVRLLTGQFETAPWPIQIKGLVDKPLTLDAQELLDMFKLEERV